MDTPRFKHDCMDCKFLGQFGAADLYFCPQGGRRPTVIARYGDEGPDYNSGLGIPMPELIEAKKRAIAKGYLTPEGKLP